MCGIIGYIGPRSAAPILISGLKRLEYRGYDSAGVALVSRRALRVYKKEGKLAKLQAGASEAARRKGRHRAYAMGHPRGAERRERASPRERDGSIAVVHNGIVENATELRERLAAEGVAFVSETDTEIIAHLVARADGESLEQRVRGALALVRGTYGIAVVDAPRADRIVVARNGSPVIIGIGEHEMFVASDRRGARAPYTAGRTPRRRRNRGARHRGLPHDGDGRATGTEIPIDRRVGRRRLRARRARALHAQGDPRPARGGRAHAERAARSPLPHAHLGGLDLDPRELLDVKRVKLLGCGSAYYAGLAGAHLIESLVRIPASAEPAAEFRYRNPVIEHDTLYVAISQSARPSIR